MSMNEADAIRDMFKRFDSIREELNLMDADIDCLASVHKNFIRAAHQANTSMKRQLTRFRQFMDSGHTDQIVSVRYE